MKKDLSIAVIMPVLNEAGQLAASIASIGTIDDHLQLIVVDGGSTDAAPEIARRAGAVVIPSPVQQRAAQMNLGAAQAHADVLLFLHADTRLPRDWRETLRNEMKHDGRAVGGAFRRSFDCPSLVLRLTCTLADWRGAMFSIFLGDQAMFVRRDVFHRLGGFAPLQRCEDLDLSLRLARSGPCRLLPATVVTSGRRFQPRGAIRQTLRDFITASRFIAGR